MKAGKIIAYIIAGILIFFGVLFIWSAFSPQGQTSSFFVGFVTAGIGLALILLAGRKSKVEGDTNVTLQVELPGNVSMDTLKCESCGGALTPDDIKMVAGAPVVSCPYCNTTYQITEEPKW
jgi:hypothetical protein